MSPYRKHAPHASLAAMKDGTVMFNSSYDAQLVAELKAKVPWQARRWDKAQRAWFIAPEHAATVADICASVLGIRPDVPHLTRRGPETREVFLEYLGTVKNRGDINTAYGYCDGGWNLLFPETVLRVWFCDDAPPSEAPTLYAVLGVKHDAGHEEIKKAYRRAARTHHPDVGGDGEQFKAVQRAWEALKDLDARARYDSGLAMAATLTASQRPATRIVWRSPVRCGRLTVEGRQVLNRFHVERILKWQDVTDRQGHAMVTFWRSGDEHFQTKWV